MTKHAGMAALSPRIEELAALLEKTSNSLGQDGPFLNELARVLHGRLLVGLVNERHHCSTQALHSTTSFKKLLARSERRPGELLTHFQQVLKKTQALIPLEHSTRQRVSVIDQMSAFSPHDLLKAWDTLLEATVGDLHEGLDARRSFDELLGLPMWSKADLAGEVRPRLRQAFEERWQRAGERATSYLESLYGLRIFDLELSSSQRLFASALEIALEIAFVTINGRPRPAGSYDLSIVDTVEATRGAVDSSMRTGFDEVLPEILADVMRRCCYGTGRLSLETRLIRAALWLEASEFISAGAKDHADWFCLETNVVCGELDERLDWYEAVDTIAQRMGEALPELEKRVFPGPESLFDKNGYVVELNERLRLPGIEILAWVWGVPSKEEDEAPLTMLHGLRQTFFENARELQRAYMWVYAWAHLLEVYEVSPEDDQGLLRLREDLRRCGVTFTGVDDPRVIFGDLMRTSAATSSVELRRLRDGLMRLSGEVAGARSAPVLFRELCFPEIFPIGAHRGFDIIFSGKK